MAHTQEAHHQTEKPVIRCAKCGEVCKGEVLRVQAKHFHTKCFTCKGEWMNVLCTYWEHNNLITCLGHILPCTKSKEKHEKLIFFWFYWKNVRFWLVLCIWLHIQSEIVPVWDSVSSGLLSFSYKCFWKLSNTLCTSPMTHLSCQNSGSLCNCYRSAPAWPI